MGYGLPEKTFYSGVARGVLYRAL